LGHTFCAGEKFLPPKEYETGADGADNNSMMHGHDWDVLRWTDPNYPPLRDVDGGQQLQRFGSAHANVAQFAFLDGSVHTLSYLIDRVTWSRLGNRHDGAVVDARQIGF
jgi:prepilin-type processing-associated H-X9-DG protein